MGWSFPIGRLFGSELRIHGTFILLLIWVGFSAYLDGGLWAVTDSLSVILALFACVVAHEYGHALTARRFGIRTPDITLLPIGGVARIERMPESPTAELLITLAGPLVNVVIWAALVLIFAAPTSFDLFFFANATPMTFLGWLASVNLFLAVFNMLPAFPMDGGRILRAILSFRMHRARATRIAASVGQFVAFFIGLLALYSGNFLLLVLAGFIFFAAGSENADGEMRALVGRMRARDAMITSFEHLEPEDTLQAAKAALIRTTQHEFPVLDGRGNLHGILTRHAIFRAANDEAGGMMHVSALMETDIPTTPLEAPLPQALDMLADGVPAVAVTDRSGRMVGYITRENLGELMMVSRRS